MQWSQPINSTDIQHYIVHVQTGFDTQHMDTMWTELVDADLWPMVFQLFIGFVPKAVAVFVDVSR